MKRKILITGICSGLLLGFFLSSFEISFQGESYFEVIAEDEEYEPSSTEEWKII